MNLCLVIDFKYESTDRINSISGCMINIRNIYKGD